MGTFPRQQLEPAQPNHCEPGFRMQKFFKNFWQNSLKEF
jgi:hypothetical protein